MYKIHIADVSTSSTKKKVTVSSKIPIFNSPIYLAIVLAQDNFPHYKSD